MGSCQSHLPEEILEQIFIRVPPHPSYLYRICVQSSLFRRVVSDTAFLDRFRERHGGTPPLLGFFHNEATLNDRFVPINDDPPCRAVVSSFDPMADWWTVSDSRHGLVLLRSNNQLDFLVWDPMTHRREVIVAPMTYEEDYSSCNTAVVCDAGHGWHGDDQRSFRIFFAAVDDDGMSVCVYSSEDREWSLAATSEMPLAIAAEPSILVGNTVYCRLQAPGFAAFNLDTDELSHIWESHEQYEFYPSFPFVLEDAMLGIGAVEKSSLDLHLWALQAGGQWALRRVVGMNDLPIPLRLPVLAPFRIVGVDEESRLAFVDTEVGLFSWNPETMESNWLIHTRFTDNIYPYKRFFTSR